MEMQPLRYYAVGEIGDETLQVGCELGKLNMQLASMMLQNFWWAYLVSSVLTLRTLALKGTRICRDNKDNFV